MLVSRPHHPAGWVGVVGYLYHHGRRGHHQHLHHGRVHLAAAVGSAGHRAGHTDGLRRAVICGL